MPTLSSLHGSTAACRYWWQPPGPVTPETTELAPWQLPDWNVGWANVSPTSGQQYRRWANVRTTYNAVWVSVFKDVNMQDIRLASGKVGNKMNRTSFSRIRYVDTLALIHFIMLGLHRITTNLGPISGFLELVSSRETYIVRSQASVYIDVEETKSA